MTNPTRDGHAGTGPGPITPDGCAVGVYERLPVRDEPRIVAGALPAGATLLELGCGTGRVTHGLLEHGLTVTAVDESPDMLARVRGARTVCSPIEQLDLGERFDAVLLGSFLVHAGDPAVRRALLDTCRRHVADDGSVLIQREGADWHERVPREGPLPGGGTARVVSSDEVAPGLRSVFTEYVFPDAVWTQRFLSRPLTPRQLADALAASGLAVDRVLTDDGTWVLARPATG